MSNKPYTTKTVELHVVGKIKLHDVGYAVNHPNRPEGYSWEPVYDLNGKMVIVWWHNGYKCLADISDFERNEFGIRTKPMHSTIELKKSYRIFYVATDNYPNLPEID